MRADNKLLLNNINILSFEKYLKNTGWRSIRTNAVNHIYCIESDEYYQIKVPQNLKLVDYEEALDKAVEILAKYEHKEVNQVLLTLNYPNSDIIKIRFASAAHNDSAIDMNDAVVLYENAKKLLYYTALDCIRPQEKHRGSAPKAVSSFISSCRLGQTEIGSYVIPVVCPLGNIDDEEDKYKNLSLFSDEEKLEMSFTRCVTNKLATNLYKIKNNIQYDKLEELEYDNGLNPISCNFYESLRDILSNNADNLDFNFEWSPAIRKKPSQNFICFTKDYAEPLNAVIEKFSNREEILEDIVGKVEEMKATGDVAKRKIGNITVAYLNDNLVKETKKVTLRADDYDIAITAHKQGKSVIIKECKENNGAVIDYGDFAIID